MKFSAVLDIGSSKVIAAAVTSAPKGALSVRGMGICPYRGYRLGMLPSKKELASAIASAVELCKEESGLKIRSLCIGVPVPFTKVVVSSAMLRSGFGGAKVVEADIDRIIMLSAPKKPPEGFELMHSTPFDFVVNGNKAVSDPVGILVSSLEAKVSHIYADTAFTKLVREVLCELHLAADTFIASSVVCSSYVIPGELRASDAVIIDCGGNHCDVMHVLGDAVIDSSAIGMGGNYITNDISLVLRLPTDAGEALKRRFSLTDKKKDDYDKLFIPYEGYVRVKRSLLSDIITARLDELGRYLLENIFELLPASAINAPVYMIGGGISSIPGGTEYISDCIGRPIYDYAAHLDVGCGGERGNVAGRITALALAEFMLNEYGGGIRAVKPNNKIMVTKP